MPRGKYWIGDLRLVFSEDCWVEVRKLSRGVHGVYRLGDGRLFAIASLPESRRYFDIGVRRFELESETVGCILLESVPSGARSLGVVNFFAGEIECVYDHEDRVVVMGPYGSRTSVKIPVEV